MKSSVCLLRIQWAWFADEPAGFHLFSGVEIPAVKYEYLGIVGTPERAQNSTPVKSGGIGNNNQGNARPVSANYIRSLLKSAERPHSAVAHRSCLPDLYLRRRVQLLFKFRFSTAN